MLGLYDIYSLPPYLAIKYKRHASILSILFLICGSCCILFPFISGLYIAFLTGMAFMIIGFYSIYGLATFNQQHTKIRLISFAFAIAWIILGLIFIINPVSGVDSIGFLFGVLFLFFGISRVSYAFRNITSAGAILYIIISILDISIASIWLVMSPDKTYLFTTVLIGIELLLLAFGFYRIKNVRIDTSYL